MEPTTEKWFLPNSLADAKRRSSSPLNLSDSSDKAEDAIKSKQEAFKNGKGAEMNKSLLDEDLDEFQLSFEREDDSLMGAGKSKEEAAKGERDEVDSKPLVELDFGTAIEHGTVEETSSSLRKFSSFFQAG